MLDMTWKPPCCRSFQKTKWNHGPTAQQEMMTNHAVLNPPTSLLTKLDTRQVLVALSSLDLTT